MCHWLAILSKCLNKLVIFLASLLRHALCIHEQSVFYYAYWNPNIDLGKVTFDILRACQGQHTPGTWGDLERNSNTQGMKVSFALDLLIAFKFEMSKSESQQLLLTPLKFWITPESHEWLVTNVEVPSVYPFFCIHQWTSGVFF